MKFRVLTNESSCIEYFANLMQMLSGLAKNCILRINKQGMNFIICEKNVSGGAEVWCDVDQNKLFSECICEGFSAEQDEILLEVIPDQIQHCLKGATSSGAPGIGSSSSLLSIGGVGGTFSSGTTATRTPGCTLNNQVMTRNLKIKLVRRKTPCLALEVEQVSVSGRSRAVWHFVPVHILPLRLWPDFEEKPDPEFDLSVFLPPLRNLRLFVDRMKRFARFITVKANGAGDLYMEINMETLARVRLTFHGLRARNWHSEQPDDISSESIPAGTKRTLNSSASASEVYSATVDIRRFGQLLSSQRIQPNWFVCNIVQDQLLQFVLLFENARLKYTLPASIL